MTTGGRGAGNEGPESRAARALVTVYGKAGCHLCDDARAELARLRTEWGFELAEVDIATDPRLFARFSERIPVIEVGGSHVSDFRVDAAALRSALGRVEGL